MSDKAKTEVTKAQVFDHVMSHIKIAKTNLNKEDYLDFLEDFSTEIYNLILSNSNEDDNIEIDD